MSTRELEVNQGSSVRTKCHRSSKGICGLKQTHPAALEIFPILLSNFSTSRCSCRKRSASGIVGASQGILTNWSRLRSSVPKSTASRRSGFLARLALFHRGLNCPWHELKVGRFEPDTWARDSIGGVDRGERKLTKSGNRRMLCAAKKTSRRYSLTVVFRLRYRRIPD